MLLLIVGIVHHTLHILLLCVSCPSLHQITVGVHPLLGAVIAGHVHVGVQLHHAAQLYTVAGVHVELLLLHPFPFTFHVIVNAL